MLVICKTLTLSISVLLIYSLHCKTWLRLCDFHFCCSSCGADGHACQQQCRIQTLWAPTLKVLNAPVQQCEAPSNIRFRISYFTNIFSSAPLSPPPPSPPTFPTASRGVCSAATKVWGLIQPWSSTSFVFRASPVVSGIEVPPCHKVHMSGLSIIIPGSCHLTFLLSTTYILIYPLSWHVQKLRIVHFLYNKPFS